MFSLNIATYTDYGPQRRASADAVHVDPWHNFFILADAVRSIRASAPASVLAVDVIRKALNSARIGSMLFAHLGPEEHQANLVAALEQSFQIAHDYMRHQKQQERSTYPLSASVDVVLIAAGYAFVAHAGDTRTYLLRTGQLTQITTDHTKAEVMVRDGKTTPAEAVASPMSKTVVNAIGLADEFGVQIAAVKLQPNDRMLMCSSTLHHYLQGNHELTALYAKPDAAAALETLAFRAMQRGSRDRIKMIHIEAVQSSTNKARSGIEILSLASEFKTMLDHQTLLFGEEGHGNQIEYLSADGNAYLWYPGNNVAVPGRWFLEESDDYLMICFQYGANTYNPVTKKQGAQINRIPITRWLADVKERTDGDLFALASGKVPFKLLRHPLFPTLADVNRVADFWQQLVRA